MDTARPMPREAPVTIALVPGSIRTAASSHVAAGDRRRIEAGDHYYRGVTQEQATVAEEEYLQIMFWLEEAGLPMTGANIARAMQLSAPTVHEMIGRLEQDGYVGRRADKSLAFTADGRQHAQAMVRRHRLIERFLTDVLGVPWDEVHEEAERLEHAMSPVLEERMLAAIGDAKTCPHGHPLVEGAREQGVLLADVEPGATVRVLRFENEAEELLHYLKQAGLHPGLDGKLESSSDAEVVVSSDEGHHRVTRSVAETVSVRADPSPPPRPPLPEQLVLSSDRYGR
jgi:DtxR family Mn-dependent transcriptional regulator